MKNGTDEGYMLYNLAQRYCEDFGTCNDSSTGVAANEELISLLFTGRGASLSNSCRALKKAADEISSLLMIPIIQGALITSARLSNNENLQMRAEGYVYSRALIPFVRKRDASNNLDSYLGDPFQRDRKSMASKTYGALATAYPNMNVDCEKIGIANGIDTCSGVVYVSDYIWIVVGVLIALVLICCCGIFICVRKRRRSRTSKIMRNDLNDPEFVASSGDLNHSMDLLEKAFSSKKIAGGDGIMRHSQEEITALNNDEYDNSVSGSDNEDDNFSDEDESAALNVTKKKVKNIPDII